jgi:hypothetical protein
VRGVARPRIPPRVRRSPKAGRRTLAARFSKKPLLTVSSGQLSSLRMGVGGASTCAPLGSSGSSGSSAARRSASSCSPWVAAAMYASGSWPASSRMRTFVFWGGGQGAVRGGAVRRL